MAGLAGLRQAVWVHRAAGLLAEVSGRLAGAVFMVDGLLLRLTRSDPMASCKRTAGPPGT